MTFVPAGAASLLARRNFRTEALCNIPSCPACNRDNGDAEVLEEDFIEIFGDPHFFSVDLCRGCGLIFSRTRSVNKSLYSPKFDFEKEHGHQSAPLAPLTEDAWNYRTKARQVEELIKLSSGSNQISFMEVGASDGMLFRMYRERARLEGVQVEGVLVESSGAALACEIIRGCRVLMSSAEEDLDIASQSQDFIVMSHCLEHFESPRVLLTRMRRYLKPGGVIYIEVPDGLRFDRSIATPLGYFHIANFNVINLSEMIEAAGYELVDVLARDHYPGLRVVARRSTKSKTHMVYTRPNSLSVKLSTSAIQRWREKACAAFKKLDSVGIGKRRLVYGAGTHTVALLRRYPEWLDDASTSFADSNLRLNRFLNRPVMNLNDINFEQFDQVFISTYAYQEDVEKSLINSGCPSSKLYKFYDDIFAYVG